MSLVAQRMIIRFTLFEGTKATGFLRRSRLQFEDETLARNVQHTFYCDTSRQV